MFSFYIFIFFKQQIDSISIKASFWETAPASAGMATMTRRPAWPPCQEKKRKKKSSTNKGQNQVARTHLFHHPVLQITPTQENGCARFFFASFIRSQTPRRTCEQIIGAAVGLRVSGGSRRRRRGNARRRGLDFFFSPLVALIC